MDPGRGWRWQIASRTPGRPRGPARHPKPWLHRRGPRSFHPRPNPGFHGEAISLCLAFPARRSTHPVLQRFTLTRPIPRHQPAWAGPGCSSGCSISTSSRSAVRWHLDDPRCHRRRSLRHRQDPSPLARPGTAPIARAVIRPTPKGLIPGRDPLPAGSTPRADSLLCPALAREAKTPPDPPGSGPLGPRKGPEHPASWTRRIVSLTTHRSIGTLLLVENGPLKFLYLCQSSSSIFKAGGSAASLSTVFLKG